VHHDSSTLGFASLIVLVVTSKSFAVGDLLPVVAKIMRFSKVEDTLLPFHDFQAGGWEHFTFQTHFV
jgi:hypothetical protein